MPVGPEEIRRAIQRRVLPPGEIFLGHSAAMHGVRLEIERAIRTHAPILIQGETGTGKEVLARLLHSRAPWHDGPLFSVRCPAASGTWLEKELAGEVARPPEGKEGGQCDAEEQRPEGTILLDEIGELAPRLQTLLDERLEGRLTLPLKTYGGNTWNVRVICATVHDLEKEVRMRRFRGDLFDRIRLVAVHLPSLRERREDIPALAEYFIETYQKKFARRAPELGESWLRHLQEREWPGNIRELENMMCSYVLIGPKATLRAEMETRHGFDPGDASDAPPADAHHALGKTA
jgi:two-component system, NtrC family, response regulator AtoC